MGLVIAVCILIPTLLATEKDNNPKWTCVLHSSHFNLYSTTSKSFQLLLHLNKETKRIKKYEKLRVKE
jgi:hypothetical protein